MGGAGPWKRGALMAGPLSSAPAPLDAAERQTIPPLLASSVSYNLSSHDHYHQTSIQALNMEFKYANFPASDPLPTLDSEGKVTLRTTAKTDV